jgi:hypothetical protein
VNDQNAVKKTEQNMLRGSRISVEGEGWAEAVYKLCKHKDILPHKTQKPRGTNPCGFLAYSPNPGVWRSVVLGGFAVNRYVDFDDHVSMQSNAHCAFANNLDRTVRHTHLRLHYLVAGLDQLFSDV